MESTSTVSEPNSMMADVRVEGDLDLNLSALKSTSGLVYDLSRSDLEIEARARAIVGLRDGFEVLWCAAWSGGEGYEFYLSGRVRVILHEDGTVCSCPAFRGRKDVACQHILWLLDQLASQLNTPPAPSKFFLLSSNGHGHTSHLPSLNCLFDGMATLENLAERLGWPYIRSEAEGGMSRTHRVRDIISAFHPDILPEDFRPDLVEDRGPGPVNHAASETGRDRTPEQCVVQGDFEATAFRLAVHDDNVFTILCKAMPPGACAAIYFDKLLQRCRKLLVDFDAYCLTLGQPDPGEATDTGLAGDLNLNIHTVLTHLLTSINRIHLNIQMRRPHGAQGAAKALVTLLEEITNRNKDALDGNRHGRTTFGDEDEEQRNLYYQFVEEMDTDTGGGYAVLDALEELSGEDLHQFKDRLAGVLHRNEVNRAPRAFILKLGAVVRGAEAADTKTGTGVDDGLGRKRSARGEGGDVAKRLR
ncbi:hypothetical protein BJX61DRAFT_315167 [Aspergillus egyptiacus]|nr:hypothetical protein BJX61DRAFT_315167 [Aspergillus egyptiacus]